MSVNVDVDMSVNKLKVSIDISSNKEVNQIKEPKVHPLFPREYICPYPPYLPFTFPRLND
jgi:hypothetical protein